MKKGTVILAAVMLSMVVTACGQKEEAAVPETIPVETVEGAESPEADTEEQAVAEGTQEAAETAAGDQKEAETDAEADVQAQATGGYADNFAVDAEAAAEFAGKIQEAVAAQDLEALAGLAAYPLYAGFPEGGASVMSAEELVSFGAEVVFTQEMTDSIAGADISNLTPSMAGFSVSKDGRPNIIFGVREGKLAISGINY